MTQASLEELSAHVRSLLQQKNWQQAAIVATEMQVSFPSAAEGAFLGGVACKKMGQGTQAQALFEKALSLDPNRYDAAIEWAELLFSFTEFSKCAALIAQHQPKLAASSFYLLMAARLSTWLGLHTQAFAMLTQANKVQPDSDLILASLADCAVLSGKTELAIEIYTKLIEKYPNYQKHHYDYSKVRVAKDYSHIGVMKKHLANNKQPSENNIYLYYALGKELEDLGQWSESFSFYETAGKTILQKANYSVKQDTDVIDKIISTYNVEWYERALAEAKTIIAGANSNKQQSTPIFVVGLPRTGSTLIERILSSHSQIESADETFYLPITLSKLLGQPQFKDINLALIQNSVNISAVDIAVTYRKMISHRLEGNNYFIDKYPFNFLLAGIIAVAFPTAKIVYVQRNPMDACFAMFKQSYFKFAYSLDDLGAYYVAHYRLRKHWEELLGDRMVCATYEEFVTEQESSTRKLLNQLDVEFDESCLAFHKNPQPSATASTLQVREKVHTRSVEKWKRYEHQLAPLHDILKQNSIVST